MSHNKINSQLSNNPIIVDMSDEHINTLPEASLPQSCEQTDILPATGIDQIEEILSLSTPSTDNISDINVNKWSERVYYCFLIVPSTALPYVFIDLSLSHFIQIIMLFSSLFIILWLFPDISRSLYSRPLYIGDIENSRFEISYINTMNLVLAIGCTIFIDNWILKRLIENKSILEITALLGGNITFFATIQNYFAKMLLSVCHRCKLNEEARSRRNSTDHDEEDNPTRLPTEYYRGYGFLVHSPKRRGTSNR